MIATVAQLSNQELIAGLKRLVKKEREVLYQVILHLAVIDYRRLYAEYGYSSLYDYCVRGLNYSASAAQRRIRAARLTVQFPEVGERLRNGTLSLSALNSVAAILTAENNGEILAQVCGKTREEIERVVSRYKPIPTSELQERITPITVARSTEDKVIAVQKKANGQRSLFESQTCGEESAGASEEKPECELFRISFTTDGDFRNKLHRVQQLLHHSSGVDSIEGAISKLLDDYLERHCPKKRHERRLARRRKRAEQSGKAMDLAEQTIMSAQALVPEQHDESSRYVPAVMRDLVLAKFNHRCSYVSADGVRCCDTYGLEIDHIKPFSQGGKTTLSNLRPLCRTHNLYWAREFLGADFMEEMTEGRRQAAGVKEAASSSPPLRGRAKWRSSRSSRTFNPLSPASDRGEAR